MLINDPKFAQSLRDTIAATNQLVSGVSEGKGTLGKLATDDQAYANLNKLLTQSTLLVDTIRADPKKYLTIHSEDLLSCAVGLVKPGLAVYRHAAKP